MNCRPSFFFFFLSLCFYSAQSQIRISSALCDNRSSSTGVHTENFFFSWEMVSDQLNQVQTAYQLVISSSFQLLAADQYDVYNTGRVNESRSIQVHYSGRSLKPGTVYYWKVKVWDKDNVASSWSDVQQFTTGIFEPSDWQQAKWIGYENMAEEKRVVPFVHYKMKEGDPRIQPNPVAPLVRKSFLVSTEIKSATLFISGLGHYEAFVNGQKIGNSFLAPGWTSYDKTVLYNTYDLTDKLKRGENALGVLLGNGFYHVSQERYTKGTGYFGTPKMIALLAIQYADGHTEYIVSDKSWKTASSPIVFNNIYGGEDYDATKEMKNWCHPSFDDRGWTEAALTTLPRGRLLPEIDYPVALVDSLDLVGKKVINSNTVVYDFGQNISGVPKIKVRGKPGQTIKLIPAELLFDNGMVNQADNVTPHFYQYTIGSFEEETWHPAFTYFAVRYVQVEVASTNDAPVITEIKLLHNRNSAPANGYFSSGDSLLNRIDKMIDWAVKSNIQSYMTDNPQREKLSWQGEQNFMRTSVNYAYNMYGMYRSHIQNLKDAQHANGLIPDIAPEYVQFSGPFVDSPEWGTTGILDMWFLYKFYGDTAVIRSSYDMMKNYARHLQNKSEGNLLLYGLGDWLDIGKVTPMGVTASAYFFKAINKLSEMAAIIGEHKDAVYYRDLAMAIKKAFNDRFFDAGRGVYATGSQTSMSMPLVLGIVEDRYRDVVLKNLIKQVSEVDSFRITAGDVGHKFFVRTLFENGYPDVLYKVTRREDTPGYAYQLNRGATALIETWDAKMSQNQLAMGHIQEWFYEGLAGIRQAENSVAFKRLHIAPQVVGNLNRISGSFHSPYGWIKSFWERKGKTVIFKIEIPVNTTAVLELPAVGKASVTLNKKALQNPIYKNGKVLLEVGAGSYEIVVRNR